MATANRADIAVAAAAGVPFALYLMALQLTTAPSAEQWQHADPILHILPRSLGLIGVPALALVLAFWWTRSARPRSADWRRGGRYALAGVVLVAVVTGAIRALAGPELPSFIPPEESARPGFLLSMTAGFGEEVLFRMIFLPLVWLALARVLKQIPAAAFAILLTGLAFALLHWLGSDSFSAEFFATRFLFPGCIMSLAFLYLNPTLVVAGHSTAHLAMPLVF